MRIAVLGGGIQSEAIVRDLIAQNDVSVVVVVDSNESSLTKFKKLNKVWPQVLNVDRDEDKLIDLFHNVDGIVSCLPYYFNFKLTQMAIATETHLCDLGGNNHVVDTQMELCRLDTPISVIPDCGLAPGLASIVVAHAIKNYSRQIKHVRIRCGGIPETPGTLLNYGLFFSANGVVNEYTEPVRIVRDHKIDIVNPMEQLETIHFNGFPELEAFSTSGGLSTLPLTFLENIENMDYKTIRYAGHSEFFRTLKALGMFNKTTVTDALNKYLKKNVPDVILFRVEVVPKNGSSVVYEMEEYSKDGLSAMQRCTGFPASIVSLMQCRGQTPRGCIPQEVAIDPCEFFKELAKRDIKIRISK